MEINLFRSWKLRRTNVLLGLLLPAVALSADKYIKREVRGAWMATVYCIDWPTETGTSTAIRNKQKQEMTGYLDVLQASNMNAIYFQVRPMADALYKSKYEPWSSYVSGTRGRSPGYDPLAFVVEECHKRGMECHAWVNPYRWATTAAGWNTAQDRQLKQKDMLISYTNSSGTTTTILNPAFEATRERIVNVCRDIIENYDVDGIIFDDYFYPSGMPTNDTAEDYEDYQASGTTLSFADWRRENINRMVAEVYEMIQETAPSVKFGISPAGAACTDAAVAAKHGIDKCPVASDWQYNGIFSDPVAWLEAGTIDYISPQLYWKTDHATNPFGPMTKWWSYVAKHFNRHHYASHSLTFLQSSNTTTDWIEVGKQVQYSRRYAENKAPGAIYYSACDIDGKKVSGLGEWLKKNRYQHPALTPAIDWKDVFPHQRVTHLVLDGTTLSWDEEPGVRYTVYAIPDDVANETACSSTMGGIQADYLIGAVYTNSYTIPEEFLCDYHFAVCILDRMGNEYEPRFTNETEGEHTPKPILIWPDDGAIFRPGVELVWETNGDADGYTVEVSRNRRFTDLVLTATSGWYASPYHFFLTTPDETWEEGIYYWRVTALATDCEASVSEPRSFTISYSAPEDGTGMAELAMSSPEIEVTLDGSKVCLNQTADDICIYNMLGMPIAHHRGVDSVDMSGKRDGIYIIKVMSGGRSVVKKVKI
jgi:uncharacterized lipoprotein YddW (UPF0748 family)